MAKEGSIMELGASTSYHSKSQPKRSHDDPKTIQFHVFQTRFLATLATFLDLVGNFPKWVPKSVPGHFRSSFAHRKELRNSGVKKSNGATMRTCFGLPTFGQFMQFRVLYH